MPRTNKVPVPDKPAGPRPTLVLSSGTWRDRLAEELVAVGIGYDQAHLVAVRVLKGLVAGQIGEPEDV